MRADERLLRLFQERRITFEQRRHAPTRSLQDAARELDMSPRQFARAVLLVASDGTRCLAVLPADALIDFGTLQARLHADFRPATPEEVAAAFPDAQPGCVPPFGAPWSLPTVVDPALFEQPQVCFEPGSHEEILCLSGSDFARLHEDSRQLDFARPLSVLATRADEDFSLPGRRVDPHLLSQLRPVEDIRETVRRIDRLPAMPEMARRLLRLRNDPDADVRDFVAVVECDPSLTAQLIRQARSAFYAYGGRVDTLEQAVTRVLGFGNALDMALGLAVSRTFRNPADGPLGLQAFWKHAAASASLAQLLTRRLPKALAPDPGVAYLAGLLHNFGFLLVGHLFRAEFFLLNRVVAANPHLPVPELEQHVLGFTHTEAGGWLMEDWDMPPAIVDVVRHHHESDYAGAHATLVRLVQVVDRRLRAAGLGDAEERDLPEALLAPLGLEAAQVEAAWETLADQHELLDALARQLAA
ncbi:MAG: HDOD domain-containing protein [Gammaproteobacteria bacterium]|nr:MAG: HDOD domain-containing protein [Gammaproteobacteria bacterium]